MATKCEIEILDLDHYLQLKSEGFEFEGQSYLFWEYMRILRELQQINPKVYFFLENVEMGDKWERVITKAIGVKGIHINSALVSAQNRRRIYWTNIGMEPGGLFGDMQSIIPQPKDRGILLKDILESEVDEKYYLSEKMCNGILKHNPDKSFCIDANYFKGASVEQYLEKGRRQLVLDNIPSGPGCIRFGRTDEAKAIRKENMKKGVDYTPFQAKEIIGIDYEKMNTVTTASNKDNLIICHNTMPRSSKTGKGGTGPLSRSDGKTYCLDTGQTNAIEVVGCDYRSDEGIRYREGGKTGTLAARARNDESCGQMVQISTAYHQIKLGKSAAFHREKTSDKAYCVDTNGKDGIVINSRIRRLTPRECGRLQTIPEHIIDTILSSGVSDSQIYKMFGNGWNIETIVHILKYI